MDLDYSQGEWIINGNGLKLFYKTLLDADKYIILNLKKHRKQTYL